MAKYPLIARVPEVWRRLDKDDVARGLFTAIDNELESVGTATENYLSFLNVDLVPDKFLPLLADLVGHIWRIDRTHLWNRNRIRFALKRASYKGTPECIKDLAYECGATSVSILDMASTVLVESHQGHYGQSDSHYFDSDYYHPGVFQLFFDTDIDIEAFDEEFQYIKPAGTRWYYNFVITECYAPLEVFTGSQPELTLDAGDTINARFRLDDGTYIEYFNWVPQMACSPGILLNDNYIATANATFFASSLSFDTSDTQFAVTDDILTREQNATQPAVEPVVED